MKLKFKFDIYQRRFKQPLRTSHGVWQVREGIIISLEDSSGNIALGEIAPLPWFGSETMSQALDFCQGLGDAIAVEDIFQISDRLPACQFAFESAWLALSLSREKHKHSYLERDLDYCYLLPAGEKVLTAWEKIYRAKANSTFKWKIGVYPLTEEIAILKKLVRAFPSHIKLRLDANGGLNLEQAKALLAVTDTIGAIEFVEQPLPHENFSQILQLNQTHTTLLGLDESISNFKQLQTAYQQGWRGIFVIKAAIAGFPSKVIDFCTSKSLDIVLSSVFETEVGRNAVVKLTQNLNHPRALGFGLDYFD